MMVQEFYASQGTTWSVGVSMWLRCGLQSMQESILFLRILFSIHFLHKLVHFHLNNLFVLPSHQHQIWLNLRRRTVRAITFAIREMNTSQLRYVFIFQFPFHDTQPFVNDLSIRNFDTLRSMPSTRFSFNRPMCCSHASNEDRTHIFRTQRIRSLHSAFRAIDEYSSCSCRNKY